jgi:hypothetical protein
MSVCVEDAAEQAPSGAHERVQVIARNPWRERARRYRAN